MIKVALNLDCILEESCKRLLYLTLVLKTFNLISLTFIKTNFYMLSLILNIANHKTWSKSQGWAKKLYKKVDIL